MSNPTLTTVTIVSNNTIKTNYAITGDEVTLSITASENINQPSVVFTSNSQSVNNSVTYSGSNTTWTAKYIVHSSDSNGDVGFTINFQSTGGNSGTAVTATTNSSSVNKLSVTLVPTGDGNLSTSYALSATINGTNGPKGGITGAGYRQELGREYFSSYNADGTILALMPYYGNRVRIFKYRSLFIMWRGYNCI